MVRARRGLVMVHEVGHLLLGTNYHGATGLRVAERPDALLARKGEAWRFSMFEAARMRRVLEGPQLTETILIQSHSDNTVGSRAPA